MMLGDGRAMYPCPPLAGDRAGHSITAVGGLPPREEPDPVEPVTHPGLDSVTP